MVRHIIWMILFLPIFAFGQNPPNVIVIFVDDMGYGDLGCYGHPTIRTPHLDLMASEGMRFTQFYAAASVCTPSRAALLTGRYPIRTGMVKGSIPGRVLFPNDKTGLPPSETTIAEVLKSKNYVTHMVGKWHLGHLTDYLPTRQGFDHYFGIPYSNDMDYVGPQNDQPGYWNVPIMKDTIIYERPAEQTTLTKRYTERAVEFIRSNVEKPFFLYLAHSMPHIPLFTSEQFKDSSLRGLYGDVIEEIDWSVGSVLDELKRLGLDKNTMVIFTSDNGPWLVQKENGGSAGHLKEGKGTTWEGGMRVPMIAWWPGTIPSGHTSTALTTTMDLLPTIAEACNAEIPGKIDGTNLLDLFKGANIEPRDFFLYYRNNEVYAARLGPWKAHFITQTEYPAGPQNHHNPPLLYNLEQDPEERYNVAKEHPDIIATITERVGNHSRSIKTEKLPTIEGESYLSTGRVTGGKLRVQKMNNFTGEWSNNEQLWWVEAGPGDELHMDIKVEKSGKYELYGFFTRAGDYGIIRVKVNGMVSGSMVDGYASSVQSTGPVSFGQVMLKEGINTITIEIVGKDYQSAGYSDGYLVGVDGFLIR